MKLHLMNTVLSPRLPRQCHGMLRDDRTVGLWCDRLIQGGAFYVQCHILAVAPHSDQLLLCSVVAKEEGHNCPSCKDLSG